MTTAFEADEFRVRQLGGRVLRVCEGPIEIIASAQDQRWRAQALQIITHQRGRDLCILDDALSASADRKYSVQQPRYTPPFISAGPMYDVGRRREYKLDDEVAREFRGQPIF